MTHPRPARALRIALVTGSYAYIQDGVALTLNRLVSFLEHEGAEVLVFTPTAKSGLLPHAGEVVPVASSSLPLRPEYRLAWGLPEAARRRMQAFGPDPIHIATPDLLGHQALAFGQRMGIPVVASYHTRYETYLKYYGLGLFAEAVARTIARFYRGCREVYAPSPSMVEVLKNQGAGDNVILWPRGVDTERFTPTKRSQVWRAARGIAPEVPAILFVGRLVREKRLSILVEVLRRLEADNVPHAAVVVGDGPECAALERQAPRAVFPGFLTGEDLAIAYASCDVFLFPSETETFGSVTLEAMASGLPTVCADATGSRSLVDPGVTGFLVEPGDESGFHDAVSGLLRDPVLRRRFAAAALERSRRFSWEQAMSGLLSRYRALCSPERSAA